MVKCGNFGKLPINVFLLLSLKTVFASAISCYSGMCASKDSDVSVPCRVEQRECSPNANYCLSVTYRRVDPETHGTFIYQADYIGWESRTHPVRILWHGWVVQFLTIQTALTSGKCVEGITAPLHLTFKISDSSGKKSTDDSRKLLQLVNLDLTLWKQRAQTRHGMQLEWDNSLVDTVADGYNIYYGARSIKHEVERRVINPLAAAFERQLIRKGYCVKMTAESVGKDCEPEARVIKIMVKEKQDGGHDINFVDITDLLKQEVPTAV